MLKIRDDFNLDDLKKYGFKKNNHDFEIYHLDLTLNNKNDFHDGEPPLMVSILVNKFRCYDRSVYVFVGDNDYIENYKKFQYLECIDVLFELPEILIKMIKDGVVVYE